MKVLIAYGTLTMNTEMIASAMYEAISDSECSEKIDLLNVIDIPEASALEAYDTILIGTSTWGEGEYPPDTEEFDLLVRQNGPNLKDTPMGFFGLGDSSYEIYNGGIKLLEKLFVDDLEAKKIGETLLIDGFPDDEIIENAQSWAKDVIKKIKA